MDRPCCRLSGKLSPGKNQGFALKCRVQPLEPAVKNFVLQGDMQRPLFVE